MKREIMYATFAVLRPFIRGDMDHLRDSIYGETTPVLSYTDTATGNTTVHVFDGDLAPTRDEVEKVISALRAECQKKANKTRLFSLVEKRCGF